ANAATIEQGIVVRDGGEVQQEGDGFYIANDFEVAKRFSLDRDGGCGGHAVCKIYAGNGAAFRDANVQPIVFSQIRSFPMGDLQMVLRQHHINNLHIVAICQEIDEDSTDEQDPDYMGMGIRLLNIPRQVHL
ncbi:hypothetical protein HK405_012718, partial [Cladochytrium tenue]